MPAMQRRRLLRALAAAPLAALPQVSRTANAGSVVVIGGGLAGLCAAYELNRAGHRVSVLESGDEVGGRARTLRGAFADGLHAEVGPLYVPDAHTLVLHYARAFNLALAAAPDDARVPVRLLRGRRLRMSASSEPDWPYALRDDERALGFDGLYARYQAPLLARIGDPVDANWSAATHAALDALSLPEALIEAGASKAAAELLTAGWGGLWGEGIAGVSALCVLRDGLLQSASNAHYRFVDGVDRLPQAFARELGERVRTRCRVIAIEASESRVRVAYLRDGQRETVDADRAVCALPFWLLRAIETPAQWSAGKRAAIASQRSFSALRTTFQMRSRYWLAHGENGQAQTDLGSISAVYDVGAFQNARRGLLQTYSGGAQARRLAALPEAQRHDEILHALDRVFPGALAQCESAVSWSWDAQPQARGASAWFAPGEMARHAAHLASAEGRVHFAGDHTSPWIRWMQGALHSGLRAAREVHEAAA